MTWLLLESLDLKRTLVRLPTSEYHKNGPQSVHGNMTLMSPIPELPVLGSQAPERADAARNRRRILAAAERLIAERGVSCVTMEQVAEAADVGKGTLFRRFGDRASLLFTLLDEREQEFQQSFLRGPAPLGPAAPPAARLLALGAQP